MTGPTAGPDRGDGTDRAGGPDRGDRTGGGDRSGDRSGTVWDDHAGWWQEHFTDGADPEYEEQILPLAVELLADHRRVVEVGCGEGQVARALAARGPSFVVGAEPSAAQVAEAGRRGGGPVFVRAEAASLPLPTASVEAVVVCLVLEHVERLDDALDELARVLRPGGRLVLFLNHPLLQTPGSGWIDDQILDPPEQYWRVGPYLPEATTSEEMAVGIFIDFHHRPLSRYVNGLSDRGLNLVRMLEPPPPPGFVARAWEYEEAASIPRLLVLVCEARP